MTPLLSNYLGWQGALPVAGLFCLVGAALWFWIHPDQRAPATNFAGSDCMKISKIDCHVLLVANYDPSACSTAHEDDLVVEIHTDEGLIGIGETDTNPWVARECIRARGTHCMGLGLEEMLLGADPLQPEAIWQKLYSGSKMTGRRGALICAMGAIDMGMLGYQGAGARRADLQAAGRRLNPHCKPYASLLPQGNNVTEYKESLVARPRQAKALGFQAGKMEVCIAGP